MEMKTDARQTFLMDLSQRLAALPKGRVQRVAIDGVDGAGKTSPEGFNRDSYNYSLLKFMLLDPLSPGGSRKFRTAAFDVDQDSEVSAQECEATDDSILIFDGIFLHREQLYPYWDFSVFLSVPFEVSIPRGAQRGAGSADPLASSNHRYVEGQKLYLQECRPETCASLVVDYRDLQWPKIGFA